MAEILNADLSFEALSDKDRNSFAGIPKKVLLSPGMVLYRFVRYAERDKEWRSESLRPFWLPNETYVRLSELHNETGIPIWQLAREALAIAFDFKEVISGLWKVRLGRAAYALQGPTARQRLAGSGIKELAKNRPESFRRIIAQGGLQQIYLPKLQRSDLAVGFELSVTRLSPAGRSLILFSET